MLTELARHLNGMNGGLRAEVNSAGVLVVTSPPRHRSMLVAAVEVPGRGWIFLWGGRYEGTAVDLERTAYRIVRYLRAIPGPA
jgi:hypothetical protein